jgi:ketosteroid isomerase-like protein
MTAVEATTEVVQIRTLLEDEYRARINAQDAAGYANDLYADGDVLWAPPDAPDRTDKKGIQAGIQGVFDNFDPKVRLTANEIEVMGDFAYAIGDVDLKLTPKAGGDVVPVNFRIVWLLANQHGGWKIKRQIWNKKPAA